MLGDTGRNAPDQWVGGLASPALHAIAILFARNAADRELVTWEHQAFLTSMPVVEVLSALDLDGFRRLNTHTIILDIGTGSLSQ